jgi:WD40 repeat protein
MRSLLVVLFLLADASSPVQRGLDPKRCGLLRTVAPRAGILIEACFSPDGRMVALVGSGPTALLYDAVTWREIRSLATPEVVWRVAFGPGGETLAVGGPSGKVTLLETETGRVLRTLEGDAAFQIHRLAFAPNGKTLLAGTGNEVVWVWDVESGRRLHSLRGHSAPVSGAAFSPRGGRAATGG